MKIKGLTLILALLVSLPLPQVTSAQVAGPKPGDWSAVTALQPGEKLAVKLKDGKNVEGILSRLSDTTLTLSHNNTTFDLNRDNVLKVYRLSKGSAKRSTLVGAGIGAVVGAGVGAAAGGCDPNDIICFDRSLTVPTTVAFCGGLGAIAGLITGKLRHKRVLIYEGQP